MRSPSPPRRLALIVLAVAALGACSTGGGSDAERSTSTSTTTTEAKAPVTVPADRPIDVQVPPSYDKDTPAPLLVLLHGFGANGALQDAYLGLNAATDEAGILYVYPEGTTNAIGRQFWNATDACCAGPRAEVDDSAYLATVIESVKSQYNVDPKRVFVVGHSNGGFMAYRMACDHADVVAAIVSLEGATYDDPDQCAPSEGVATLEVHGLSDTTILYDGGEIAGQAYPSATTTVETWAAANGCSPTPDAPAPPDRAIVRDLPPAEVTSYSDGCKPGGHAELWTQPEGTHIPAWTADFSQQLVDWLLEHPKP